MSSLREEELDRADEVLVVDPRDVLRAAGHRAAEPQARQARAARRRCRRGPGSSPSPRAARPCASRGVAASRCARSHALAMSTLKRPVAGDAGLVPPMTPVASSFGGVEAVRVDGGRAHLQPRPRRLRARDRLAHDAGRVDARAHHLGEVLLRVAAVDAATGEVDHGVAPSSPLRRPRAKRSPVPSRSPTTPSGVA